MSPRSRLAPGALAAYAAPAAPLGALYFPVFVYVAPFYAGLGVDLALLGAAIVAVRLADAVSDPVMGVISDRLVTRWGRRRIWLAVATPLIVLAAWRLFLPPAEPGVGYAALWLTALTLAWTVALTPYYAWGAEIAEDYAGRARVTSWREASGLLGAVAAAVLYAAAGGPAQGLVFVFGFLAVALPLATVWALARAPEPRNLGRRRLSLRDAARAALGNRAFLRLLAAYFVNGAANALPASLFLFFVAERLEAEAMGGPFLVLYFVSAIVGAPFWGWAAGRMSKHRVWCLAMLYACAVFLWALTLGPGDLWPFAAICVLSGLALGADLSLPPAMQADVVDWDTAATGEQRTGAYFAVWSVATKAALAISGGIALMILGAAGFRADAANDPAALWTLALLYAGAPVALKLVAVAMMWGFPLDEAAQRDLRARIEARAVS